MISIGEGRFELAVEMLSENDLRDYAITLFEKYDRLTSTTLPIDDYTLFLYLEQGSLKGIGKVLTTVGVFIVAIEHFGGIVQGVREMVELSKIVQSKLIETAAEDARADTKSMRFRRSDTAILGKLQSLFEDVENRKLSAAEANKRAVELLSGEEELTPEVIRKIENAFNTLPLRPHQPDFWPSAIEETGVESPIPPKRRKGHIKSEDIGPIRSRIGVEIRREGKSGKTSIRIVPQ